MNVKYYVNYWYDGIDSKDIYKYVLVDTKEFYGNVDDVINSVPNNLYDFYFMANSNLPLTLTNNESKNVINIYNSGVYRKEMYDLAVSAITESVSLGNANVFLKLIGCIYGDMYMQSKNIDDAINVDKVDEEHLRHLSKLVDYTWSEALTADEQRESVKFYMMLRRMRGTNFALTNLIRIFGQSADTLYQPTDNTGVRVIEYYEGNSFEMFPGDIRVEIPEMSKILRDAINDVKLMGTRITFAYRLPIDSEYVDEYGIKRGYRPIPHIKLGLTMWLQPGKTGWTEKIDFTKKLSDNFDNHLIYKYVDTFKLHSGIDVKTRASQPYIDMWMFQEYGLSDVRGVLLNDGVIEESLFLYR